MADATDEGRIRVGTQGWVYYLLDRPIAITITEIRLVQLTSGAWELKAACDDGSGDRRWYFLDEIHTDREHHHDHAQ